MSKARFRLYGLRLLGLFVLSSGAWLTLGGAWLASLGGSLYYLSAGLVTLVVAVLMIRLRGRWVSSVLLAAVVTVVVHQIFYGLLLVPLPWGVLESLIY